MEEVRARLLIRRGEDYSAYIEWTDFNGNPVPADPGATAMLHARDKNGSLVVQFASGVDPEQKPAVAILGRSGIIRVTCPRHVTAAMPLGVFPFDLAVQHTDADAAVFRLGQRRYIVVGDMIVADSITKMPAK